MHPLDCPVWDYKSHANYPQDLRQRVIELLRGLRSGQVDPIHTIVDTRGVHGRLFVTLTPPGCAYYAGHFRGEDFRCLRYYEVGVRNDPRVGAPPSGVMPLLVMLKATINSAIPAMDLAHAAPSIELPEAEKLKYAVIFACRIFEEFLRTHPYADGNGHLARFLICAILGRYGYWPNQDTWPIDPRPPGPYGQLILDYRNGNVEPLEMHVLSCYL